VSTIGKDEKTSYLCSAVVPVSSPLSLLQPGGYLPGTMVTVQYVPPTYPSCYAQSWSGCGASGSGNMISFTMNSNCTITAYVWCP
jgi:hypothetical protein